MCLLVHCTLPVSLHRVGSDACCHMQVITGVVRNSAHMHVHTYSVCIYCYEEV